VNDLPKDVKTGFRLMLNGSYKTSFSLLIKLERSTGAGKGIGVVVFVPMVTYGLDGGFGFTEFESDFT
jgi:hypothetical protein